MKLAVAGYQVTGVDLSPSMIRSAREKSSDQPDLSFIEGSLMNLPFDDGEFDAAMAINSLEWTEDLGPTAAPRQNSFRRLYGEKVIMNTMQIWEFEKMALENGWQLIAEDGTGKRGIDEGRLAGLSKELQQALSFLWVFILKKTGEDEVDGKVQG